MNSELILLDLRNRHGVEPSRGRHRVAEWSANVPMNDTGLNVLRQIHLDYLNAVKILTANTFRTHRRALVGKGYAVGAITEACGGDRPGGYR